MNKQNQRIGLRMWQRVVVLVAMLVGSGANAQTAIESVTGSLQGGAEVIRIDLSQALKGLPTGFAIQSPARIALDFPGVVNAMGRSTIDVNQGNLKSVTVVQAGERSRVVLNLKQPTAYKAEIQGKSLLVALEAVAGSTAQGEAPAPNAARRWG